jgi:hypothetical protein
MFIPPKNKNKNKKSQNQIDGESNSNQSKVMQDYGGLCVGPIKPSPLAIGCHVKVKDRELFYSRTSLN